MIHVSEIAKTYNIEGAETQALRGVSFDIKKGEFVAIMGPSGSGKSTLLHVLGFLDRPTSGSYTVLEKRIEDLNDNELAYFRNKEMGFVFQSFNLLSRSTVFENVELPLLYSDVPKKQREQIVTDVVKNVGLEEKLWTEAGRLSGGQQQRVAIARALVNDPNIIFADEPTGNLDSHSGAQVMEILKLLHTSGKTVILVTHETYTSEFANRLIRLLDGKIEYDGPIKNQRTSKEEFFK